MLILLLLILKFPFKHLLRKQLFCLKNFAVTIGQDNILLSYHEG